MVLFVLGSAKQERLGVEMVKEAEQRSLISRSNLFSKLGFVEIAVIVLSIQVDGITPPGEKIQQIGDSQSFSKRTAIKHSLPTRRSETMNTTATDFG